MPKASLKREATERLFRLYVVSDRPFYATAAFIALGSCSYLLLTRHFHFDDIAHSLVDYLSVWFVQNLIVFPIALVGLGYVRITLRLSTRRRLAYRSMFSAKRVARVLAGTLMMAGFLPFRTMFNSVKNVIPEGQGFPYDRIMADLDKAMHFGRAPHEWLHGLLGQPIVLKLIEMNYETIWFVICFGSQYWVAVAAACDKIRLRYVLTYMLIWTIVGNVFATIFASAGPVYYGAVTGDTARFADLQGFMTAGEGAMGLTTQFQQYLWYLYSNNIPGLGSGISAFPSMHVAIVVMNALFLVEARPKWAIPAFLYVAFVMMSSVYLGWHYAVDGYAAVALTVGVYLAVKKVMSINWVLSRTPAPVDEATVA